MYIHIYFNFLALNDKKKLNSLYLSLIMKFTPKRYKNELTLVQKNEICLYHENNPSGTTEFNDNIFV